jgi:hypothetical protein
MPDQLPLAAGEYVVQLGELRPALTVLDRVQGVVDAVEVAHGQAREHALEAVPLAAELPAPSVVGHRRGPVRLAAVARVAAM